MNDYEIVTLIPPIENISRDQVVTVAKRMCVLLGLNPDRQVSTTQDYLPYSPYHNGEETFMTHTIGLSINNIPVPPLVIAKNPRTVPQWALFIKDAQRAIAGWKAVVETMMIDRPIT